MSFTQFLADYAQPSVEDMRVNPELEPQIMRYETEAMAEVRRICTDDPLISHNDIDAFKKVLSHLQRNGFSLRGPSIN